MMVEQGFHIPDFVTRQRPPPQLHTPRGIEPTIHSAEADSIKARGGVSPGLHPQRMASVSTSTFTAGRFIATRTPNIAAGDDITYPPRMSQQSSAPLSRPPVNISQRPPQQPLHPSTQPAAPPQLQLRLSRERTAAPPQPAKPHAASSFPLSPSPPASPRTGLPTEFLQTPEIPPAPLSTHAGGPLHHFRVYRPFPAEGEKFKCFTLTPSQLSFICPPPQQPSNASESPAAEADVSEGEASVSEGGALPPPKSTREVSKRRFPFVYGSLGGCSLSKNIWGRRATKALKSLHQHFTGVAVLTSAAVAHRISLLTPPPLVDDVEGFDPSKILDDEERNRWLKEVQRKRNRWKKVIRREKEKIVSYYRANGGNVDGGFIDIIQQQQRQQQVAFSYFVQPLFTFGPPASDNSEDNSVGISEGDTPVSLGLSPEHPPPPPLDDAPGLRLALPSITAAPSPEPEEAPVRKTESSRFLELFGASCLDEPSRSLSPKPRARRDDIIMEEEEDAGEGSGFMRHFHLSRTACRANIGS